MNPTLLARQRVVSESDIRPISCPRTSTSPPVGRSRPAIRFSRVVLPEPDGPIRARNSPSSTSRSRSWSTGMRISSRRYSLDTPRSTIAYFLPIGFRPFSGRPAGRRPASGRGLVRAPPILGLFDDLDGFFLAEGLRRVEHDALAALQPRLDAGQVVVGLGDLDHLLVDLLLAVDDPDERVPGLLHAAP